MSDDQTTISRAAATALGEEVMRLAGFAPDHARAITASVVRAQGDECHSHGLYRLLSCAELAEKGKVDPEATPLIDDRAPAIVKVDACRGVSLTAFAAGLPLLVEKAKTAGLAALAINNCYHFSALWPEIEAITDQGLVALAMTVSHAWVAPAGGAEPVFGTNPLAFGWPRPGKNPFVFDFATSAIARGDLELHRRSDTPLPEGVAVDAAGNPTTDPLEAVNGAMLTFGGHKGSALSTMIELLAGPLIGDMTSAQSLAHDDGAGVIPMHGELILALDPASFLGGAISADTSGAEALLTAITRSGARLPSSRRYAARRRNADRDMPVRRAVLADIEALAERLRQPQ
ncbi:Ldh family oxidoreductase [Martelella radicis]|uniref:LDH2 family malate/lactate/ureidoglycolate dehydrogenase n=1 Tax=Martelella radicis TaxID=1397476 RepID=A0A7W6KJW4_9HYPH|nr:Ldh family oxidoreductase [Martelella radicis]MBB4122548.1 LDH2 family malate/lactate/ureidoglycolate dehydrogenase [Martelella radicis]